MKYAFVSMNVCKALKWAQKNHFSDIRISEDRNVQKIRTIDCVA
jgi:hypothetical protein